MVFVILLAVCDNVNSLANTINHSSTASCLERRHCEVGKEFRALHSINFIVKCHDGYLKTITCNFVLKEFFLKTLQSCVKLSDRRIVVRP